ncbi:AraC family transcriptional regulator [Carnobacterium gallinarum]|uniref:AraC family transcriptional regulator n=1 Tax=Carnobacterium gallinarum TaxID=2749 RepID=UPI000553A7D5|nr:AraC family transcriptional regulator [Carnobacterium gallinarum]
MAIYLEIPKLDTHFPFRCLVNEGEVLTTPHWHKELELILVTEGIVNLGINDQPTQLKKGEIIVVNSGDIHYVLASPRSERLVFQFDLQFFHDTMLLQDTPYTLAELFSRIQNCSQDWSEEVHQKMVTLLLEIYEESIQQDIGFSYSIKGKLNTLIILLFREVPQKENFSDEIEKKVAQKDILEKLDLIFRYVEENYTHLIKLDDVAYHVGFSTYYFAKFFKKNTGNTFITFLNEYRIDKAKWLLLNEDIMITELVERVGFGSNKTFYRLFKKTMGISPLAFRSEYQR